LKDSDVGNVVSDKNQLLIKNVLGEFMKKNKTAENYNLDMELEKGATLTAASYDKTQKITVIAGKVTVGGKPGIVEISGIANGAQDAGIDGTLNLWLSIFRYMRPDGTTNHVAGWNIALALKAGQTPLETANAFTDYINTGKRPYKAKTAATDTTSKVTIIFTENITNIASRGKIRTATIKKSNNVTSIRRPKARHR
jgi:hypothetical protein